MTPDELATMRAAELAVWQEHPCRIAVCTAAGCLSTGSAAIKEAFVRKAKTLESGPMVRVLGTGCLGLCYAGPLARVESPGAAPVLYEQVAPGDVERIVERHAGASAVHERDDGAARPGQSSAGQFFAKQRKIVLANAGRIDSERIEDYVAADGYRALQKVLTELTPQQVIQEVIVSGLRGRGGGGYPTGLKWNTVGKGKARQKTVVCNADEGDPGAFMDRSVLEGDPHRVLEGIAIAAYAVGAEEAYIYVRGEYPLAVSRLKIAIRQAERHQLLGNHVFDTSFNLRIELRIGAGAFVCGEETALIASIEGRRGTPHPRPPYPAHSGLWGQPTLINNVETFANIAPIVLNGGAWYAGIGTAKSRGTKVFALAGRVARTGLIEVPMGITLREIVFDIGGGIPDGRRFKAAQTGGPSGGCIPADHLDLPVDYESLMQAGSIMGSGGLIVMDDTSCMVDVARFFMEFCRDESCGKCVPCRAGTVKMHELLCRITSGRGTGADVAQLDELSGLLKSTSLCGLGQTAPNPVVSTVRHFHDEYMAHIVDRRCPAGVCRMDA
jgi:bidirectional [NiFe] hydrogenase diaphorase subunit